MSLINLMSSAGVGGLTEYKLQSSDIAASDHFGEAVVLSSDGNTLAIGAANDTNSGGALAGSVYIFIWGGTSWIQQARLQASDATASDYFGEKISISSDGSTLVVGVRKNSAGGIYLSGGVYIFVRNGTTWTQQTKLVASDPGEGEYFGWSTALSADGNTLAVGAIRDDNSGGVDAGSAYIYVRSGTSWAFQSKLQASDAAADDYFGASVALSSDGHTLVVGANNESVSGSAYVFTRSGTTWTQQAKLLPGDAAGVDDEFGYSCSISNDGNTAAIGAYWDENSNGTYAGSVYIFIRSGSTWVQEARIQANNGSASDHFGFSVSLSGSGNTIAVGSRSYDLPGFSASGSAYVFTRSGTTWTQMYMLKASDPGAGDYYGSSVSISKDGNTIVVGAWGDDSGGFNAGSAYTYTGYPGTDSTQWINGLQLFSSLATTGSYYGSSNESVAISLDNTTLAIGMKQKNRVDIYYLNDTTWTLQTSLQPINPTPVAYAGNSLAFSSDGNTLAIGAPWAAPGSLSSAGRVDIYTRSGGAWSLQGIVFQPTLAAYSSFGESVALSNDGNTLVVGAPYWDNGLASTYNCGIVHIFTRSGGAWSHYYQFNGNTASSGGNYGYRVAISGNATMLAVSAPGEDNGLGRVYLYRYVSNFGLWENIQYLTGLYTNNWGMSLDMSNDGTWLVGGAPGGAIGGSNSGYTTIYKYNTTSLQWDYFQLIYSSTVNNYLGQSVSFSGDGTALAIGATGVDLGSISCGAVYLYKLNTAATSFTQNNIVYPSNPSPELYYAGAFGEAVALNSGGTMLVVSASGTDYTYSNTGYVEIRYKIKA